VKQAALAAGVPVLQPETLRKKETRTINWLVFITVVENVYSAVRTEHHLEFLNVKPGGT
jgi:hypothetical protein